MANLVSSPRATCMFFAFPAVGFLLMPLLSYRKGALGASCYCFACGVRSKWRYEHVIKGYGEYVYVYGKRVYSVNKSSIILYVRV